MKVLILALLLLSASADAAQAPICRSPTVVKKFKKATGYPHGRPGYVADHICALSCGGKDEVSNLQWQTVPESRAKDRWENTDYGCSKTCPPGTSRRDIRRCPR